LAFSLCQPLVGAGCLATADVADVHHEGERLRVHLVDQPIEPLHFVGRVGRIPEHAESDLTRRKGLRAAREDNEKQGETRFLH
jgi:hypothetical protein